jgi:restriction system protein
MEAFIFFIILACLPLTIKWARNLGIKHPLNSKPIDIILPKNPLQRFLMEKGYMEVFIRKRNTLVYQDEWGDVILHDYDKEIERFINKKWNELKENKLIEWWRGEAAAFNRIFKEIFESVETEYQHRSNLDYNIDFKDITDPLEYENEICNLFSKAGFKSHITSKTGDQGIDVIAEKNGFKVGVQCKLYSSKIGNSAVQEAFSGKVFYNLNFAIVCSNAEYTKSALQLASTCKVSLLHHMDLINNLETLEDFLKSKI